MLNQSLFIKACRGERVERAPIWIMRQAGRYLPEYRALRDKYDFISMCQTPEIASEITLQPIRRFGMDAAIIFSDILVTPQALGCPLRFQEGVGPIFDQPIRSEADAQKLNSSAAADRLDYVYQAIRLTKQELGSTPLIGFAGAPFTVAAYLVEGRLSKNLHTIKQMMYQNPELLHTIMKHLEDVSVEYLNRQIMAGADAIQIFESWAHALSWDQFHEFSLPYIQRIIRKLDNPHKVPVIVFARGSSLFAPSLTQTGANVLGLDWNCSLQNMRESIPNSIALQGNFDPHLMYASIPTIQKTVSQTLTAMQKHSGYIVNLGHGLLPDMNPDHVAAFVQTVQTFCPTGQA